VNFDLVWTPEFQSDRYLNGERFSFFSPLVGNNIGGQDLINPVLPSKKINNGELALRLYKNINGIEYAAYAYRGFDKQPVGLTNELQATFYRRNTFGGSLRGPLGSGLFNLEISYNDSIQDSEGNNPLVSNSQWRFLIGYERELVSKLTWSSQFYLERMNQYQQLLSSSPFPQYESEKNRQLITQRFRYRAMQDKLTLGLFIFYSPTDDDAYLRPSVNYRQNDNWSYSLGANIFEGQNRNSFFGQFEDSTNSYIRIRYNF
jgi:hypothetical protein